MLYYRKGHFQIVPTKDVKWNGCGHSKSDRGGTWYYKNLHKNVNDFNEMERSEKQVKKKR